MSERGAIYFVQRRVRNLQKHPGRTFYIGHQVQGPNRNTACERKPSTLQASANSNPKNDDINAGSPSAASTSSQCSSYRPPMKYLNTDSSRQAMVKEEDFEGDIILERLEDQKENLAFEGISEKIRFRPKRKMSSSSSDDDSICSHETIHVKTENNVDPLDVCSQDTVHVKISVSPDNSSQETVAVHQPRLEDEDTEPASDPSACDDAEMQEVPIDQLSSVEQDDLRQKKSKSTMESTRISLSSIHIERRANEILTGEDDQNELRTQWTDELESLDKINLLLGNINAQNENAGADDNAAVTTGEREIPSGCVIRTDHDYGLGEPTSLDGESTSDIGSRKDQSAVSETGLLESDLVPSGNAHENEGDAANIPSDRIEKSDELSSQPETQGEAASVAHASDKLVNVSTLSDESCEKNYDDSVAVNVADSLKNSVSTVKTPCPQHVGTSKRLLGKKDEDSISKAAAKPKKVTDSSGKAAVSPVESPCLQLMGASKRQPDKKDKDSNYKTGSKPKVVADAVENAAVSPVESSGLQHVGASKRPVGKKDKDSNSKAAAKPKVVADSSEKTAVSPVESLDLQLMGASKRLPEKKDNDSNSKTESKPKVVADSVENAAVSPVESSGLQRVGASKRPVGKKDEDSNSKAAAKPKVVADSSEKTAVSPVESLGLQLMGASKQLPEKKDKDSDSKTEAKPKAIQRIEAKKDKLEEDKVQHFQSSDNAVKSVKMLEMPKTESSPSDRKHRGIKTADKDKESQKPTSTPARRQSTADCDNQLKSVKIPKRSRTESSSSLDRKHRDIKSADEDKGSQKFTSTPARSLSTSDCDNQSMVDPTKISARQGNLKSFLKLMREKNKMKNSEPKVSGTEDENRSSNYLTGPNEKPVSRSPVTSIDASNASTSREKNISKVHVICEASVGLQSSGYNIDASEEPTKEEMVTSKGLTNDELDSRRRKKEDRKSSKNSQSLISIRDGSGFSNDDSVRERKKRGRCRRRHSSHCQEIDEREYLNYEEYWDQRYRKESEQLKPYWEVLARSKRKEHATSSQTIEIYSECRRTEGERISFSTLKLSSTPDPRREERWRSWAPSSPPSNYEEYGKRPWINTSPQACEERKTRALLNSSRLLQGKKGRRRCSSSSPPSLEKDGGLLPICVSLSPSGGRRTSWINPSPPRGNSGRCRAGEGDLRSSDHNEKTGDEVHEEAENLQPSTSNEATASFSENATESSAVPQEPYTEEQKRLRQKFIDRILESWPKET